MIRFLKQSTFIAIVLFAATTAYAGDLKAVNGGNSITPAPQGGKATALEHVSNQTAIDAITKEEDDKVRRLRPVK
jgi:hypothetical protein